MAASRGASGLCLRCGSWGAPRERARFGQGHEHAPNEAGYGRATGHIPAVPAVRFVGRAEEAGRVSEKGMTMVPRGRDHGCATGACPGFASAAAERGAVGRLAGGRRATSEAPR